MTEPAIRTVSVAEAKASLSELLAEVESGVTVEITRRGRRVATVTAVEQPKRPADREALRALTDTLPWAEHSAGDLVCELRDDARY